MNEKLHACLSLLAIFQQTDEEVTEEEAMFIGRAASDLNLNEEELEKVKNSFREKQNFKEHISQIKDPAIKRFILRRIVAAVLLDGKIAKEEKEILNITKEIFNLKEEKFQEYIEWMKEGIEWEKRGEKLLNELITN